MQKIITKFQPQIDAVKGLHEKYEKYVPAAFFVAGFLLDVLTLGEIDDLSNILMQTGYLLLCFLILQIEYRKIEDVQTENKWVKLAFKYRDDMLHFFLGALLSAFTLFYFKSGSISNSFLFMVVLAGLLVLNELEIFQKQGVMIRSGLFMLCLISYLIYLLPVIIGKSGIILFFLSITLALTVSVLCFRWLNSRNQDIQGNIRNLLAPHSAVAIIFIALYLFRIFPPVPLSIKKIAIYHDIQKTNGTYVTKQQNPWWRFWHNGDQEFNYRPGDKIFVLVNIFSPAGYAGNIYIRWLMENRDGDMITSDRIPFSITGGRIDGFRGYAYKQNYTPGNWQVRIETEDELEIGRINLSLYKDDSTDEREFITKVQ